MSSAQLPQSLALSDRFARSWEGYVQRQKHSRLRATLEQTITDELETHVWWLDKPNLLKRRRCRACLRMPSAGASYRKWMTCAAPSCAARVCESPIEVAMLAALTTVGKDHYDGVVLRAAGDEHAVGDPDGSWVLHIEPQAMLGDFRVDFLLTGASKRFFANDRGGTGKFSHWHEERLVVECDGHDFHNRSPQQASRDHERDRRLQALGYMVYRYTGSDIWRDVCRAGEEVMHTLMDPPSERNH